MTKEKKDYSDIPIETDDRLAQEHPKLVNYAKSKALQSASANDVVQSTYGTLYGKPKEKRTLPYLWGIFLKKIADRHRRRGGLPNQLDDEIPDLDQRDDLSIFDNVIKEEKKEKSDAWLNKLLPMLSDREADTFCLLLDGKKRAEIIDELGITEGMYGHSYREIIRKGAVAATIVGIDASYFTS